MLRAKSRSGSVDLEHKKHSSIFSRTKLCRGDVIASQINSNALVSADNKPQSVNNKDITMQAQREQLVEELDRTKEYLVVAEGEKEKYRNEIKRIKQDKKVGEVKVSEVNGLNSEVRSLKELSSKSKDELKQKDEKIKILEMELENVKKLDTELAARDSLIDKLKRESESCVNDLSADNKKRVMELEAEVEKVKILEMELENAKKLETELAARDSLIDKLRRESESRVIDISADNNKRVMELEAEVEKAKISEHKMLESLQQGTKLLEETKIELEETKLESVSFQKKVDSRNVNESRSREKVVQSTEETENQDHQLAQALERERIATMKAKSLQDELELVKNELKQAIDAEETSKNAMDELALVLKEVTTESNQVKEKHVSTLLELEHVKEESEQLKEMVRNTEERYQKLLDEAKKETDLHRNTADRLRFEAEESLLAWNGKEMGFVNCIKISEEEKAVVQHEKAKLAEVLKATEVLTRSARDENFKLRDILKQAINEANAAKAAAGIARDENSLLKDSLNEKDEALLIIHKENKRLRINDVAAKENLKEFKRLLSSASMEDKIGNKETNEKPKSPSSNGEYEEVEEENVEKRTSTFDQDDLKVIDDQDPEKAEELKGSIFYSDYSPKSEPPLPIEVGTPNSENHGSEDSNHLYDSDSDRNMIKTKKALFRRFSDIIMKKKMVL